LRELVFSLNLFSTIENEFPDRKTKQVKLKDGSVKEELCIKVNDFNAFIDKNSSALGFSLKEKDNLAKMY
jgi:hypothetical protein